MYDLVVLGGGAGGLNVASAAAKIGAKVALVEKHKLGGDCTHAACVPSKALIQAARLAHLARTAGAFGIRVGDVEVDFAAVMERVQDVVTSFAGTDSGDGLQAKGIDVFRGSPAFEAYDSVVIDGRERLNAHRFVIATGSRPAIPEIPGLAESGFLDNTNVWSLRERPESLAILGGGPVGLEFGQAFARLGTEVTIVSESEHILPCEDPEVSRRVQTLLSAEGITFHTGMTVTGVVLTNGKTVVKFCDAKGDAFEAPGTHLFVATGRHANVEGLNLEAVGIHATAESGIEVDETLRTSSRHILALGDVIGHHQWTHAAEREAAVVIQNAVLRLSTKIDYSTVPRVTFVDPEVASVGLSESEARVQDAECRVFRVELTDVDRARIDGATSGFAKVATTASGKILGAAIVGPQASAVLQEFVLAMEHGLTLMDLAQTAHTYPTYAGLTRNLANQFAATRLEKGYVQTALRWVFGYQPRNGTPSRPEAEEAVTSRRHQF